MFMFYFKKICFILWLFCFQIAFSQQFALINDPDGWTNVRSAPNTYDKPLARLTNGTPVLVVDRQGNWYSVMADSIDGFVYYNRLQYLSIFVPLPVAKKSTDHWAWGNDSILIEMKRGPFSAAGKTIGYQRGTHFVEKINGKPFWGCDGHLPSMGYRSVEIHLKGETIALPPAAIEDLFQPCFSCTAAYFDPATNTCYLCANNSDGAGGYYVLWIIGPDGYQSRSVEYGF